MTHPLFELVTTSAGAISIRNRALNEIMHNPVGPWAEANALYIQQSGLKQRLATGHEELVIFDVGLGAAANALATLHCVHGMTRKVRLISFERDLQLLHFAIGHAEFFSHFNGYVDVLKELLAKGSYSRGNVTWELRHGDFFQLIVAEPARADLIFYDPYSPKVNQEMWTVDCFSRLRQRAAAGGATLFTYSQATPIRVALLHAGFFVGHGLPTGLKKETTQAATRLEDLASPLGPAWFERWRKSHRRYPSEFSPEQQRASDQFIASRFPALSIRPESTE